MPKHDRIDYPVEEIRQWIADGKTQQWIAEHLQQTLDSRITAKLIYKVCKKHSIECQRTGPREGPGHPEWQGGRIVDRMGYVHLWAPEHPECKRLNAVRETKANGKYYRKEKYIQEHRLVMEKHIGRYLEPQEVVHHINGIRDDNRICNLVLFRTNAEHLAVDLKGRCPKWSEDGKARLQLARLKRIARIRLPKEPDAQKRQQMIDQWKAELPPCYRETLQTAVQPLLQPA